MDQKIVTCKFCGLTLLYNEAMMNKHMMEEHKKLLESCISWLQCDLCEKIFGTKEKLHLHRCVVHGATRYMEKRVSPNITGWLKDCMFGNCDRCNAKLKNNLKETEIWHHREYRAKCTICRNMLLGINMKEHMRKVHPENFMCIYMKCMYKKTNAEVILVLWILTVWIEIIRSLKT
jgi:hypothetical protein